MAFQPPPPGAHGMAYPPPHMPPPRMQQPHQNPRMRMEQQPNAHAHFVMQPVVTPTIGFLDPFDPNGVITFTTWFELFEEYCTINNILAEPTDAARNILPAHNRRRALFLSSIGQRAYAILHGALLPQKPNSKSIPEMVEILKSRYEPPGLQVANRFKFGRRFQATHETAVEYISALQHQAVACGYGDYLEQALRDQLVAGIRNPDTNVNCSVRPILRVMQDEAVQQQAKCFAQSVNTVQAKPTQYHNKKKGVKQPDSSRAKAGTSTSKGESSAFKTASSAKGASQSKPFQMGKCHRCGFPHDVKSCPAINWVCKLCKKLGHTSAVCRSAKQVHAVNEEPEGSPINDFPEEEDYDYTLEEEVNSLVTIPHGEVHFIHINGVIQSAPEVARVSINGMQVHMEIDSGAGVSLMSDTLFTQLFPSTSLSTSQLSLVSVTGPIKVLGQIDVKVSGNGKNCELPLVVCATSDPFKCLMGRIWLDALFPKWRLVFNAGVNNVNSTSQIVNNFKEKYPNVFDPHNDKPIKKFQARLVFKKDVVPIFHKAYPLAYALYEPVGEKLDSLVHSGKAEQVQHSDHASPCVVVLKKSGDIRLCIDFKKTLNKQLDVDHYPLPVIQDIFAVLSGGAVFTVLDLSDAYTQVLLHPDSRQYVTVNTHKGLYRFFRLVYGIASAPAIFQCIMDMILKGIKNVMCYLDDILIMGTSFEDCVLTTTKVIQRLNEFNVRIQLNKCIWFVESVDYLGHVISKDGRRPSPSKVEAILKLAMPTNVKEVRSYLGMVTYYCAFLKDLSTVVKPIRRLTEKAVPFQWSKECELSFRECNNMLASDKLLIHYDPSLPLVVLADASPVGLGAVLNHVIVENGKKVEKPVMFASCTLNQRQQAYSQLDREAMAIIFAVTKFYKFLMGRKFKLVTDNAPIRHIFSPDKSIPIQAAQRLQHWACILEGYQYELEHRKSDLLAPADALSRLPSPVSIDDVSFVESFAELPLNPAIISEQSRKDNVLSRVMEITQLGWPDHPARLDDFLKVFFTLRHSLSLYQNCLFYGSRVVIPQDLQMRVLNLLHEGHPGVVRMKLLARSQVWWPNLSKDIETKCQHCTPCSVVNFKPSGECIPWPKAPYILERMHIDFYEFEKCHFLIACDAHSKYLFVNRMENCTAETLITMLMAIFSFTGNPKKLVSDNGPPFTSEEYMLFCTTRDIFVMHTPPYHPASNGQVERSVQIAKKALKKMVLEQSTHSTPNMPSHVILDRYVSMFLTNYRNTPTTTTGKSPNEILLSFQPRTMLTQINPKNEPNSKIPTSNKFKEGDEVFVKVGRNPPIKAVVVRFVGGTRYLVSVQGVLKTPHVNQMSYAPPTLNQL